MPSKPEMFAAVGQSLDRYLSEAEESGAWDSDQVTEARGVSSNLGGLTETFYQDRRLQVDSHGEYAVSNATWDAFFREEFRQYL